MWLQQAGLLLALAAVARSALPLVPLLLLLSPLLPEPLLAVAVAEKR